MDTPQVVETDGLSLEQIRDLAEKEVAGVATEPKKDDVKVAPAPKEEAPKTSPKTDPVVVYRREIDLGDGGGIQVFQANTADALLDQLAEAQKNATKKIREQATRLKEIEAAQKVEEAATNNDNEFVLSQEMMSKPTEAVKKIFKQMTGMDISEFKTVKQRSDALEIHQNEQRELAKQEEAVATFLKDTPTYIPNKTNGAKLNREVLALVAEARAKGGEIDYNELLVKAFTDLSSSGLLETKAPENVTATQDPTEPGAPRIADPGPEAPAQRRKGSSLSASGRPAPVKNAGPSEEELYKMPLEKLQELAEKEARAHS